MFNCKKCKKRLDELEKQMRATCGLETKIAFWNTRKQYVGENDPYFFTGYELLKGLIKHLDIVPVRPYNPEFIVFEKRQLPTEEK